MLSLNTFFYVNHLYFYILSFLFLRLSYFYALFIIILHVDYIYFDHSIHFIYFNAYHKSLLSHVRYLSKHAQYTIIFYPFFKLSFLWPFYVILSHPSKFHQVSWSFSNVSNFRDASLEIWLWKLAIWLVFWCVKLCMFLIMSFFGSSPI